MNKELEQAEAYINAIDFSAIIEKMVHQQGWRKKDVWHICRVYRRFLFLKKKYGHQYKLPPSEEIDVFWHHHILDAEKYQKDCQAIFGTYLEHYPYLGID